MVRFCFCRGLAISAIWIIVIILQAIYCEGDQVCQTPADELSLQFKKGDIQPRHYPDYLVDNQYCEWTFPHQKYFGLGLLILVDQVDLVSYLRNEGPVNVGDLRIGDGLMFLTKPAVNCKLFGKNLTDVDLNKLFTYVKKMHESFGRFCTGWYFDSRLPNSVVFRAYVDRTPAQLSKKTFLLKYDYVDVTKNVSGEFSPKVMTTVGTLPIETTSGQAQTNESGVSKQNSNVLVLTIVCVVLIGSNILLLFLLWRKHRALLKCSLQQLRETQSSSNTHHFNVSSYASISDQGVPYATVSTQRYDHINEDTAPYASVAEHPPPSQVMYDVPTNNRMRTPTVHSSHSVVSEFTYQASGSGSNADEEQQMSETHGKVKDVYAVVDKTKKTRLQ